jgi:hypothetical protein
VQITDQLNAGKGSRKTNHVVRCDEQIILSNDVKYFLMSREAEIDLKLEKVISKMKELKIIEEEKVDKKYQSDLTSVNSPPSSLPGTKSSSKNAVKKDGPKKISMLGN